MRRSFGNRVGGIMKRFLALALCFMMIPSLAAFTCGANGNVQRSSGTAEDGVKYQERIVIGSNGAIIGYDLQDKDNMTHSIMFTSTHDGLVYYNNETAEIEPRLATSWEWTTDNVIEFELRDDVKFHDGSDFTAEDVVFTFERAKANPGVFSSLNILESVEALDDYHVRMTLTKYYADWLNLLCRPIFLMLSKSATEADPEKGPAIGTGPFILKELIPSDRVEMVRNDNYWGELTPTKELSIVYIAENSSRMIALQNGEIDICIAPNSNELVYAEEDENLDVVRIPGNTCFYLAINSSKAPGNDQNLRLALAYCLNLDDILTVAADGRGVTAVSNWGPQTFGYYDGFGAYGQDYEKAKEYLDKAYPDGGAKLAISVSTTMNKKAAEVIQAQAHEIGLEIEIDEVEAAMISSMSEFNVAEHQAMIYSLGWNTYGDDAQRPYYPGSNINKAIIDDSRISELLDEAVSEKDDEARKEMYKQVQEINHEEAYYIPLYYSDLYVAVKKGLGGVSWAGNQRHDFSRAYIVVE